jgi:hypothetical protein
MREKEGFEIKNSFWTSEIWKRGLKKTSNKY